MLQKKGKEESAENNTSSQSSNSAIQTSSPLLASSASSSRHIPTLPSLALATTHTSRFQTPRKRIASLDILHTTKKQPIVPPAKKNYPILALLCTDDTESRAVFGDNLGDSASLLQGEKNKIRLYLASPFISTGRLRELILLLEKAINVTPKKYHVMSALGDVFAFLVPIESISDDASEKFKKAKLCKQHFIDTCTIENYETNQNAETLLEYNHLPRCLKPFLLDQEKRNQHEKLCKKLKEKRKVYQKALLSEKQYSSSLNNKNPQELATIVKIKIKRYNALYEDNELYLPDFIVISPRKLFPTPAAHKMEQKIHPLKDAQFKFYDDTQKELKQSSESPYHEIYMSALKHNNILIPMMSSDEEFLISDYAKTRLAQLDREYPDCSLDNPLEFFLNEFRCQRIKQIEETTLHKISKDLLQLFLSKQLGFINPIQVENQLFQCFHQKRQGLNIPPDVIIPWTDDPNTNPFLYAIAETKQAILSQEAKLIDHRNEACHSSSSSHSLPSSASSPLGFDVARSRSPTPTELTPHKPVKIFQFKLNTGNITRPQFSYRYHPRNRTHMTFSSTQTPRIEQYADGLVSARASFFEGITSMPPLDPLPSISIRRTHSQLDNPNSASSSSSSTSAIPPKSA